MGLLSKNIGMDEVKNQKTQSEYFAGKSDFQDFIITNAQRKIKLLKLKLLFFRILFLKWVYLYSTFKPTSSSNSMCKKYPTIRLKLIPW